MFISVCSIISTVNCKQGLQLRFSRLRQKKLAPLCFRKALRKHGLPCDDSLIRFGNDDEYLEIIGKMLNEVSFV